MICIPASVIRGSMERRELMATAIPSHLTTLSPQGGGTDNLARALRPWRGHLTRQQVVRWSIQGIFAGLILAILVLLIARLLPWATAQYWALGLGGACLLLALSSALWFRPSLSQTAQIVDRRLELHDRLSTAWELRTEATALAGLQRRDALKQLGQHQPSRALPLRFHRSTALILLAVCLALVGLIVLPNPMNDVIKQRQALQ